MKLIPRTYIYDEHVVYLKLSSSLFAILAECVNTQNYVIEII